MPLSLSLSLSLSVCPQLTLRACPQLTFPTTTTPTTTTTYSLQTAFEDRLVFIHYERCAMRVQDFWRGRLLRLRMPGIVAENQSRVGRNKAARRIQGWYRVCFTTWQFKQVMVEKKRQDSLMAAAKRKVDGQLHSANSAQYNPTKKLRYVSNSLSLFSFSLCLPSTNN